MRPHCPCSTFLRCQLLLLLLLLFITYTTFGVLLNIRIGSLSLLIQSQQSLRLRSKGFLLLLLPLYGSFLLHHPYAVLMQLHSILVIHLRTFLILQRELVVFLPCRIWQNLECSWLIMLLNIRLLMWHLKSIAKRILTTKARCI